MGWRGLHIRPWVREAHHRARERAEDFHAEHGVASVANAVVAIQGEARERAVRVDGGNHQTLAWLEYRTVRVLRITKEPHNLATAYRGRAGQHPARVRRL